MTGITLAFLNAALCALNVVLYVTSHSVINLGAAVLSGLVCLMVVSLS